MLCYSFISYLYIVHGSGVSAVTRVQEWPLQFTIPPLSTLWFQRAWLVTGGTQPLVTGHNDY